MTKRMMTVAATLGVVATVFAQWTFKLDTTFRTSIVDRAVNSLLALPDGRLFASGLIRYPGDLAERGSSILLPDGSRDQSYMGFFGGSRLTPWINDQFYASSGLPRRMLANGDVDQTFIALYNGPYFLSLQNADYHVYADGSVVISGSHLLRDSIRGFEGVYNLIWFTNTGYLDTTRTHRQANGTIWNFKELPDGKFICTCSCTQYEGQPVSKLFRIHADGALDTTFQTDVNWGNIYAYYPLPDGRVLVGGQYKRASAPNDTLYLARYMSDGSLDETFINGNQFGVSDGLTGIPKPLRVIPWEEDKFFVMGYFRSVNDNVRGGLCVIDSSGTLLPWLEDCIGGTFTFGSQTGSSVLDMVPTLDSSSYYICGSFVGYNDGTTNDTLQRFVSRLLVTEDIAMGIKETAQAEFQIYPNPASNSVTLEVEELAPNTTIFLCDALGRELLHQKVTQNRSTLQVQYLPNGMYTVEIRSANGWPHTERLVVQH